ncbi:lipopolysaccharide biosynthesis protein [Methylobacterium sp. J-068]|uniref:lipopolysaccharide biosynthesis protein n=1 Tax=Methylobacterium sp. J-068 TaxID=2836649 RepID=UPI001FBB0372|nr:polysaccharide biosynthesis C-terminal domain-containing protein [Methylobacterium sp. J-068]MCJ2033482.1 polysaccharide biosynthesis C-terminal domain-containing protein [Methylobacterium sp. J-068]
MNPPAMGLSSQRATNPAVMRSVLHRLWSEPWLWSAGSQALSSGMSLIVSVIAARLLGVADFGAYVLIHAGVVILAVLQYQIVAGPMMIVSGHRTRSPSYFGTVARAALLVSLAIGVVIAIYCAALIERPGTGGFGLPAAAFVFALGFVSQDNAKRLAFAMGRPRSAFAYEALRHVLFVVAVAAIWWLGRIDTAILLACGGVSAMVAALPIYLPILGARSRGGLRRVVGRHHWLLGRWLALVVFVSAAHEQVVTILAGSWINAEASAGLRAAQVLLGPLLVLMTSLENIVPRQAARRFREGGREALAAYLTRVLLMIEVPVVVVCAVIGVYSADILRLLMGPGFASFATVSAIIVIGPPITLAREFGVIYLRTTRNTHGIFLAFSASALVTVAAIYPLIRTYGVEGAAWATILGHAVSTAVILYQVWRLRPSGATVA